MANLKNHSMGIRWRLFIEDMRKNSCYFHVLREPFTKDQEGKIDFKANSTDLNIVFQQFYFCSCLFLAIWFAFIFGQRPIWTSWRIENSSRWSRGIKDGDRGIESISIWVEDDLQNILKIRRYLSGLPGIFLHGGDDLVVDSVLKIER